MNRIFCKTKNAQVEAAIDALLELNEKGYTYVV